LLHLVGFFFMNYTMTHRSTNINSFYAFCPLSCNVQLKHTSEASSASILRWQGLGNVLHLEEPLWLGTLYITWWTWWTESKRRGFWKLLQCLILKRSILTCLVAAWLLILGKGEICRTFKNKIRQSKVQVWHKCVHKHSIYDLFIVRNNVKKNFIMFYYAWYDFLMAITMICSLLGCQAM
jgi:hypothetical protein